MENTSIQALYAEWQSAVVAHANLFREGRRSGLTQEEIDELGRSYVMRIDAAFARLKHAEAEQSRVAGGLKDSPTPAWGATP
jgi:hypothetical protein